MNRPYVRVLGSADWHVTAFNDNSCYTIDDRILIDACPSALISLLNAGVDPTQVSTICFTHLHADHCMGLPALLHYWRVVKSSLGGLTIVGPKATVRAAVDRALQYIFHDCRDVRAEIAEFPNIVELEGDCVLDLPDYHIAVMNSDHAVPGLCYCITCRESGRKVGLTGDTRYQPAFAGFYRDADLLLHECSFGGGPLPAFNEVCRHSSAREAVRVCAEARVRRLLLTHTFEPNRKAALEEARAHLSIPLEWAVPGSVFEF